MTLPESAPGAPIGPPPPLDAEVSGALAAFRETMPVPLTPALLPALRQPPPEQAPQVTDDHLRRGGAFEIEERLVRGAPGDPDIPLLVCRPTRSSAVPAFYHVHGGGMVSGDNRAGLLEGPLAWAEEFGTAIVSVEYRLAPEHPHPAPVEDCYAGLVWTADHAAELGIDPNRIIVVGRSAGGGLAAAVALLARDRGGPALLAQMLLCPMLDDRNDTPSSLQMAGIDAWDHTSNETGWTGLLGERRGGPDVSPYAAPARATDLSALPPAFIDVGSCETFRDEDIAYAVHLWQAGGQAELHVWPGGFHGFDDLAPHAALSRDAKTVRRRWLRRLLGP